MARHGRDAAGARAAAVHVDTHRPAGDFDVLAFNLSAELTYTNVLTVDLAGVPLRTGTGREDDPIVIAGGLCAINPEPLSPSSTHS